MALQVKPPSLSISPISSGLAANSVTTHEASSSQMPPVGANPRVSNRFLDEPHLERCHMSRPVRNTPKSQWSGAESSGLFRPVLKLGKILAD